MRKTTKKLVGAAVSALLCVPVAMGALSACKEKGGKNVDQTQVKDSAAVAFTQLGEVKVTDAYAANGMSKEIDYLLSLDADKLLYFFYVNAELTPKTDFSYGVKSRGGLQQWEGGLIGGHTMGHYLSALAQAYANANTPAADKAAILERIQYVVTELKACQDNAVTAGSKEGFLWGASLTATGKTDNYEYQFDSVEKSGKGFTTDAWVPWYTMHKIVAGLYDCATLAGDATAKQVLLSLGDWVYNRVSKWDRVTQLRTLKAEYGGMNDCMYNLYALTGDDRYAVAANKFDEDALFEKVLGAKQNYLDGLHANTTIPKILGALNRYVTCHGKTVDGKTVDAENYLDVAETFWQYVIDHHTYLTGGNSEWEHFGKDDILNGERTNANCETCNTYNMLKLSRTLFTITGEKKYLDYYENTYYNAILSSQNPDTGMTTYFQPMATGYFKVYSSEENHFWCCTGSGMESFTKLGDSIYYTAGNATYVSLYLASEYKTDGVSLTMNADLENSDTAEIKVNEGSTVLRLRRPYWSDSFGVTVNKDAVVVGEKDEFVSVEVKKGDTVKVNLEKKVKAYNLPDGENVYGFLYGPYLLSAELGTENMTTGTTGVSVTVPARKIGDKTVSVSAESVEAFMDEIDSNMKRGENGKFTLAHNGGELTYSYHFRQHTQRYGIYFEFTAEVLKEEVVETVWERQDTVQPGYGQYENDTLHAMQETNSVGEQNVAGLGTYRKANAGGSFTYRMKVDKSTQNRLVLTFAKADNNKTVLVKSGSTTLYSATLSNTGVEDVYTVIVNLPASVVAAAQTVTYDDGSGDKTAVVIPVTFSGVGGAESARLCGYIYSEALTTNNLAYFVDCGDHNVNTVSGGDALGRYNSVTEQVYGTDAVTGKKWGIVDNLSATWTSGAPDGVNTNSTWAYEFNSGDNLDKEESNRYTKNQYEEGIARQLHYKFDLDNGTYTVKMYFTDPWSCSKNPCIAANGEAKITNGAVDKELTFTVTVTNGSLALDITSSDLCINLCYIKIVIGE